jgi:HAD superfamily hydrolase (TIGR01509 family)
MKPKALLLDLGNVTVRLRGPGWLRRLGEACTPARTPEELMALLHEPDGPHYLHERGRLDGPGFHRAFQQRLGFGGGYDAWLRLWNDYFEPNRPMEALVARLRGQARFWALSNTNAQHLEHLRLNFRVFDTFEGITASHELGAAKPEPALYQAAIAGLGLAPQEILYLDDIPAYIEAGRGQGLQAFHYTFNDDELRRRLLGLGFTLPPLDGASAMAC